MRVSCQGNQTFCAQSATGSLGLMWRGCQQYNAYVIHHIGTYSNQGYRDLRHPPYQDRHQFMEHLFCISSLTEACLVQIETHPAGVLPARLSFFLRMRRWSLKAPGKDPLP
jgi:hypothetical protein